MRQYAKSRTGARLLDGQDLFFFFQAEDGIRDYKVTGVQTCALPICLEDRVQGELAGRVAPSDDVAELVARERTEHLSGGNLGVVDQRAVLRVRLTRSGERRVGEECRSRWSPYHLKKKKKNAYRWICI